MAIAFMILDGFGLVLLLHFARFIHGNNKCRAPCDYSEAPIHSQVTKKKGAWVLVEDNHCMFDCALAGTTTYFFL